MSLPRIVATKITCGRFDAPMLLLGRCGENLATQLVIDATEWQDGSGVFQLLVKRADGEMFTATIEQADGVVTWTIPAAEIGAPGYGEIELNYVVDEVKAKSARVDTRVFASIEIDSLPPNGTTWSQLVLAAVHAAMQQAALNGCMYFRINSEGHLTYVRTNNAPLFAMEEGRLYAYVNSK